MDLSPIDEVPGAQGCYEAEDGLGEGVVHGKRALAEEIWSDSEVLSDMGGTLALGDAVDPREVHRHLPGDSRSVAVLEADAVEILTQPGALLLAGRTQPVLVEESAEGYEKHGVRQ